MNRGRGDSDTFILQSDARIQDLDRELEILRQKRQIIQEQMTQKPYGAPYMPETTRQQWNQPFQQSQHLVQYPIMPQLKQLMNTRVNQIPQFNQNQQFNQNPPRRAPNAPRRPLIQMGRQKSPPRRPNNPPRRANNPPPRSNNPSTRPTYPTSRPTNPPTRPPNPPNVTDKKAKQRKRPRKPTEGAPNAVKSETVKPANESAKSRLIFRENEEPSNQVMGRLELALGTILKLIRMEYEYPPHNIMFTAEGVKHLKAEIRKRVRTAMVGKYLGTINETMEIYRNMYPIDTDREMVMAMKRYQESHAATAVMRQSAAEETFRQHLKVNFKTSLDEFFVEMITKMKTLCAQEEIRVRSELEAVGETEGGGDASVPSQPTEDQSAAPVDGTHSAAPIDQTQSAAPAEETQWHADVDIQQPKGNVEVLRPARVLDNCQSYAKMTYYLISRKLPEVLGKYKDIFASFVDEEKLFNRLYERKQKQILSEEKEQLATPIYLKILGKPTLPPKKETVLFLKHFNIVSLKKHTKLNNMLVAAVSTKQDYEAMMAANGIKLGNSTLFIQRSKSKTDDSCEFGECAVVEPTNGDNSQMKPTALNSLDNDFSKQIDNLLTNIRKDDEAIDECRNAKKFKKGNGEEIDSTDVFGVDNDDSDTAMVIDEANDPETVTADSTNVDGEGDGIPTGFEVIDSIHGNSDETPQENDSQATNEMPAYSDASTADIGALKSGDELKDENNLDVSINSLNDVEIVETLHDVITIDDENDGSVSSESRDVKPVVVAAGIVEPRRSTRNITKN